MDSSAAPIGTVLDRPTGELALLWQGFARALDRVEKLAKEAAKLRKEKQDEPR